MEDNGQSKEELERLKLFYEIRKLIAEEEKIKAEVKERFWYRLAVVGGLVAGIGTVLATVVKLSN